MARQSSCIFQQVFAVGRLVEAVWHSHLLLLSGLQEDGWMDVLLQHIVQTKDRGGYDLAVDWLFAVFAATSTAPAAEERNTQPGATLWPI